jgi:hypothetical protein
VSEKAIVNNGVWTRLRDTDACVCRDGYRDFESSLWIMRGGYGLDKPKQNGAEFFSFLQLSIDKYGCAN